MTRQMFACAVGLGLAAACTTFGTGSTTTDGGLEEAGGSDAGGDASRPEAAPPPRGPFCADAGVVTFCDEFDRIEPFGGGWTNRTVVAGGSLAIVAESGRGSLRATVPQLVGEGYARLEKVVELTPRRVRLDLGLAVSGAPSAPAQLIAIYFGNVAAISLVVGPAAPGRADGGPSMVSVAEQTFAGAGPKNAEHPVNISLASSTKRVRLSIDLESRRLALLVDGASSLDVPLTLGFAAPGRVSALVGVVYANPTPRLETSVRDVVFDVQQ